MGTVAYFGLEEEEEADCDCRDSALKMWSRSIKIGVGLFPPF
jgi:hypothetical protein